MKTVNTGGIPWKAHPFLSSDLATPGENGAVGPLHGRNDQGAGMPPEATLTPAADEPPVPEEVASDVIPGPADSEGSFGPAGE